MALTIVKSPPNPIIAVRMPVVFQMLTGYTGLCHITGMVGSVGDSIEPDTAHKATFEFSDYLRDKPVLNAGLTVPAVHNSACPSQTFVFAEVYGTPPTDHNIVTTSAFRLLAAKVPHWKKDFAGTITNHITGNKPFLTWYPNQIRKVLPGEMIHLYYLVIDTSEYLYNLQFTITYTDASTDVFNGASSAQVNNYSVVQLDASPAIVEAWALANEPDKIVSHYAVRVAYYSAPDYIPVSESRSFVINRMPFTNPRQIIFRNSFGTFDQVMLRGIGTITATTERLSASRQANYDAAQVPDRVTWYNEGRQMLQTETGYLLKAERAWLNELLTSTEVYEKQASVLIPVMLKTEKMTQLNDETPLISIPIEMEYLQTPVIETV